MCVELVRSQGHGRRLDDLRKRPACGRTPVVTVRPSPWRPDRSRGRADGLGDAAPCVLSCTHGKEPSKVTSDVSIDFPADENSAPDFAILREDARREGKRYSFEDVLLISEVVSASSARKDYDDCTAKYGRYDIPVCLVVDPYAQEVVLHTQSTATGYIAAHTHKYGTGKLPIPLADGRTFTLDLDELPCPTWTDVVRS